MTENNKKHTHEYYMKQAVKQALKGYEAKECPIGCVIVDNSGRIISRAYNKKLTRNNPILHAEIVAIDKACKKIGDWRLNDCDMYVTLEPCTMCAGAIVQARIRKVYFGAYEPKSGAVCSCNDIFNVEHGHNHSVEFEGGLLEEECSEIMKRFFKEIRIRDQRSTN
ncbi:MAG: tRNA adenosine(34) deaminase TadA [Clostridiales bacterium]|nr:tRNA adenosine(34) deaminase TadA [Clostridiales bacterium]